MFDDTSSIKTPEIGNIAQERTPEQDLNTPTADYIALLNEWRDRIAAQAPGFKEGLLSSANC